MNRTFEAGDLVILPRLDASSAVALGEALLTLVKEEEELAEPVAEAAKRLKQALFDLSSAARARLDTTAVSEESRVEAHRTTGAGWKALHDFLASWTELSEESGGERTAAAKRLFTALFDDGLKFLKRPYATEWAEAEHRLKWIAEHQLDDAFEQLGGSAFLAEVRAAHKRYGEVLGIKKPMSFTEPASIREPFETFRLRLRKYVVQVTAQAELDEPGAADLAARLLAPLAQWDTVRTKAKEEPEVVVAPPAPPVTTP